MSKWKKNVDAAKDAKRKKEMTASPTPKSAASTASPAPPASSYTRPYEGDPEKRHFKTDKVDVARTGSSTRDNSIGLLYNGIAYGATESIEEIVQRAAEVEAALFRVYKKESDPYRAKLRSLFTSLKRKDNSKLRRQVLTGEIPADKFVVMTEKELASEEQRARDEALEKENMKKAQVAMPEKSISVQLKWQVWSEEGLVQPGPDALC